MADYVQSFYHSRRWRKTQAAFMADSHYICRRCGRAARIVHHKRHITPRNIADPNITLDWSNLEALCMDCHAAAHSGASCARGLGFDEHGDIVKTNPPPMSGKSMTPWETV